MFENVYDTEEIRKLSVRPVMASFQVSVVAKETFKCMIHCLVDHITQTRLSVFRKRGGSFIR